MRAAVLFFVIAASLGQLGGPGPVDPVVELNRRLQDGSKSLEFDNAFGYLPSILDALRVPKESQLLVFSKTSLQSLLINPGNPRAIFFNDAVTVAWVRGSPLLELTAQDPRQGMVFYTIDQSRQNRPVLQREEACLVCHRTASSFNVPEVIVRTVFPKDTGAIVSGLAGSASDHRTPFDERWGGWYVTGAFGPVRHLANAVVGTVREAGAAAAPAPIANREPLPRQFNTTGYLTPYSDVVALSVFEHQAHMMNLIARGGANVNEFVDYLLFVDEAPMMGRMEGTSGFAEKFAAAGPFDKKGRSLRQFDLDRRLMRYPCSYMIYSDAFNGMPEAAKSAIYRRMLEILSGKDTNRKYEKLSPADRKAVVEILTDTIPALKKEGW